MAVLKQRLDSLGNERVELHQRLESVQAERDELRRQLEQSEISRARYREEAAQLQARIEELESATPLDWEKLHQPEIKERLPAPSVASPDDSLSLEDLAIKARLPVEAVHAQLEKKGHVSAGAKNWVRSGSNPERFVIQPKAKRKNNKAT